MHKDGLKVTPAKTDKPSKFPVSPQTKLRCHLFHGEYKTLYTATGTGLSQAWELRVLQSCLPAPQQQCPLGELQLLRAGGTGVGTTHSQEPEMQQVRGQGSPKPASAGGWTRHTWNKVCKPSQELNCPCFPAHGPESCRAQSQGFLWSTCSTWKQKAHWYSQPVPPGSVTYTGTWCFYAHHSFSSRWNSTTPPDIAAEIKIISSK